ncbi:Glycine betaine/carnitine/choline transport ATP-binding protein opuCA [Modestobacter italicus]|uniref:ABC-type quaternary amine transporter n=1 Tax=Modestobacter italicus (strain DSM 44449 / CECT 9708 / BC 501) TaxID=2732864 RepID=I4ES22_MODI5|nr:ATP-binding cassette domain-containing protein [Modestobacter marinus]CCH86185.1 Glycine betaine/carnitine/choline transport ATP-binding protein opuCA [Modestobacter marinus]
MDVSAPTGSIAAAPAQAIRLEGVSKTYPDGSVGVRQLDLTFAAGELTVLVGPSGCGKTTTMKMINRIIEPTTGRVLLGDDDVTDVDPVELRRRIGYVIQNVGLFPHQTVRKNIGTVPRLLGWDKRRTADRVEELLDLVGLDPAAFGDRYPHQLSGGQRQRAGVARALAADPAVLLMDEPFSAVDPIVRERLQSEFLRLQETVRKTIVFVTHDIEEAVRLGDRIAVMSQGGKVEQFAPPAELLGSPATPFVADFVGADRGLKRLAVTGIDMADLEQPPVVHADDDVRAARAVLERAGARWAVVLDDQDRLNGWISTERATGSGTVREAGRRMDAWVPIDASLKTAFSTMLQLEAGWVAVLDGERFCGVLTPESLHAALRRSIEGSVPEVAGAAHL